MKKQLIVFCVIVLSLLPVTVEAIPAYPYPIKVPQPDGGFVTLSMHGDEFMNYMSTEDGYTVVRDDKGYYVYAGIEKDALVPTVHKAKDSAFRSLIDNNYLYTVGKGLQAKVARAQVSRVAANADYSERSLLRTMKAAGTNRFRGLVILVEFSDKKFIRSDAHDIFTDMINQKNYTGFMNGSTHVPYTGSVCDYFHDNSKGQFEPEFDVVGPVQINYRQTSINQTERAQAIMQAACTAADNIVDYRNYDGDGDGAVDMVYFIFAGYGSNVQGNNAAYVWPHASSLPYFSLDKISFGRYACSTELGGSEWESTPMLDGIGTICHEFSHVLGLPDLYDTDYEGSGGQTLHPQTWSVMAGGSYLNYSRTPCGYSLYERYASGWATPRLITEEGDYTLLPISESNEGYRINTPVKKEFFLLENRQLVGWDAYLPGHGMLVYRVDSTNIIPWVYNQVNANPTHPYYELIRANGVNQGYVADSDSDPFPGTRRVKELGNFDKTPHLLSWSGKRCAMVLKNIVEAGSTITFNTKSDVQLSYVEDFEGMAVTTTDASSVQGVFSRWDFEKGALIQAPGSDNANGEHSVGMVKGAKISVIDPINAGVNKLAFTVWNPTTQAAAVRLYYSTDKGVRWSILRSTTGEQDIAVPAGKRIQLNFDVYAELPTLYSIVMPSGSTTQMCYVDDFTVYCDTELITGISEISVDDETSSLSIFREGNLLFVEGAKVAVADVLLYSADGILIDQGAFQQGRVVFSLPHRGIYIIHCGGKSLKTAY